MRSHTLRLSLIGLSAFALMFVIGVAIAIAEDKQPAQPAASVEKSAAERDAAQPAGDKAKISPEQMMAEWMKVNSPGPQQAMLKKLAGNWKAEVTMSMAPGAPTQTSKGTNKSEMILGDRYLKSDFAGEMMGMPFKGVGLMGHDNMKKKFVSLWIDEMTTGFMTSEGTADATGKVITFTGECPEVTGETKPFRHVFTIESDDKHTFEAYAPGPDGKEFKMMTIVYTREK